MLEMILDFDTYKQENHYREMQQIFQSNEELSTYFIVFLIF